LASISFTPNRSYTSFSVIILYEFTVKSLSVLSVKLVSVTLTVGAVFNASDFDIAPASTSFNSSSKFTFNEFVTMPEVSVPFCIAVSN
jgi:hypothetical protein